MMWNLDKLPKMDVRSINAVRMMLSSIRVQNSSALSRIWHDLSHWAVNWRNAKVFLDTGFADDLVTFICESLKASKAGSDTWGAMILYQTIIKHVAPWSDTASITEMLDIDEGQGKPLANYFERIFNNESRMRKWLDAITSFLLY